MAVRQDASTGEMVDDGKPAEDKPKNVSADGKPMMHVKVHSPFKVYFDEAAFSISAENDTGPFDILPRHHNFMTLLNPCEVAIVTDWLLFETIDFGKLKAVMNQPVIFDGRNCLNREDLRRHGFRYYPMGRPSLDHEGRPSVRA